MYIFERTRFWISSFIKNTYKFKHAQIKNFRVF